MTSFHTVWVKLEGYFYGYFAYSPGFVAVWLTTMNIDSNVSNGSNNLFGSAKRRALFLYMVLPSAFLFGLYLGASLHI